MAGKINYKEMKRGFASVVAVVLVVLALGVFFTFYKLSKDKAPVGNSSTEVVILKITPSQAKIGDLISVDGKNLNGFEGDKNLWIENYAGEKGIIYGIVPDSTETSIKFALKDKYCTIDTSYSGLDCPSFVQIITGEYSLFASPWGNTSNRVKFVVTIK